MKFRSGRGLSFKIMVANKSETKKKTKRKGNPTWVKGGPSPNPAGAPKRGQSWAETIKEIGNLTPDEARSISQKIFAQVNLGNAITLREAVVMRVFAGLLFDPTPGNFRELMDRADGPVKGAVKIETWQDELIEALRRGDIKADEVVSELGDEQSRAILIAAQSAVISGGETAQRGESDSASS